MMRPTVVGGTSSSSSNGMLTEEGGNEKMRNGSYSVSGALPGSKLGSAADSYSALKSRPLSRALQPKTPKDELRSQSYSYRPPMVAVHHYMPLIKASTPAKERSLPSQDQLSSRSRLNSFSGYPSNGTKVPASSAAGDWRTMSKYKNVNDQLRTRQDGSSRTVPSIDSESSTFVKFKRSDSSSGTTSPSPGTAQAYAQMSWIERGARWGSTADLSNTGKEESFQKNGTSTSSIYNQRKSSFEPSTVQHRASPLNHNTNNLYQSPLMLNGTNRFRYGSLSDISKASLYDRNDPEPVESRYSQSPVKTSTGSRIQRAGADSPEVRVPRRSFDDTENKVEIQRNSRINGILSSDTQEPADAKSRDVWNREKKSQDEYPWDEDKRIPYIASLCRPRGSWTATERDERGPKDHMRSTATMSRPNIGLNNSLSRNRRFSYDQASSGRDNSSFNPVPFNRYNCPPSSTRATSTTAAERLGVSHTVDQSKSNGLNRYSGRAFGSDLNLAKTKGRDDPSHIALLSSKYPSARNNEDYHEISPHQRHMSESVTVEPLTSHAEPQTRHASVVQPQQTPTRSDFYSASTRNQMPDVERNTRSSSAKPFYPELDQSGEISSFSHRYDTKSDPVVQETRPTQGQWNQMNDIRHELGTSVHSLSSGNITEDSGLGCSDNDLADQGSNSVTSQGSNSITSQEETKSYRDELAGQYTPKGSVLEDGGSREPPTRFQYPYAKSSWQERRNTLPSVLQPQVPTSERRNEDSGDNAAFTKQDLINFTRTGGRSQTPELSKSKIDTPTERRSNEVKREVDDSKNALAPTRDWEKSQGNKEQDQGRMMTIAVVGRMRDMNRGPEYKTTSASSTSLTERKEHRPREEYATKVTEDTILESTPSGFRIKSSDNTGNTSRDNEGALPSAEWRSSAAEAEHEWRRQAAISREVDSVRSDGGPRGEQYEKETITNVELKMPQDNSNRIRDDEAAAAAGRQSAEMMKASSTWMTGSQSTSSGGLKPSNRINWKEWYYNGLTDTEATRKQPMAPLADDDNTEQFGSQQLSHVNAVRGDAFVSDSYRSKQVTPRKEQTTSMTQEQTTFPRREQTISMTQEQTTFPRREQTISMTQEQTISPRQGRTISSRQEQTTYSRQEQTTPERQWHATSSRQEQSALYTPEQTTSFSRSVNSSSNYPKETYVVKKSESPLDMSVAENNLELRDDKTSSTPFGTERKDFPVEKQNGEVFGFTELEIYVRGGPLGVGFSIEGGKESSMGDRPITVKRVFKGSDGSLKPGDEILRVNEKDFRRLTHYDAWAYLKALPEGPAKLSINRPASLT